MSNIAAAVGFLGFVILIVILATLPLSDRRRRPWSTALILYCIAATVGALVLRRDFWPFSSWSMMGRVAPLVVGDSGAYHPSLVGVTASGDEYLIDYRAWEPLNVDELGAWLRYVFPHLSLATQDSVGAYLLAAANRGRTAVRAGSAPGSLARTWGPLTAPGHLVHAKNWTRPGDVPAAPFVEIRLYSQRWDIEGRAHDPTALHLDLVYRFPHS